MVAAVEALDADLDLVEGLRHDEAFERYKAADIVVDQLNAGWYGLFAIECMALGKPVVTFLHDEAVQTTEEALGERVPIVRATQAVAKGKNDTMKRWRKLIQINPSVGAATNRIR